MSKKINKSKKIIIFAQQTMHNANCSNIKVLVPAQDAVRGVSATKEWMNNNMSISNNMSSNNSGDAIFGPSTILCLDCLPLFACMDESEMTAEMGRRRQSRIFCEHFKLGFRGPWHWLRRLAWLSRS